MEEEIKKECYMIQQDDEFSNWYQCSNCNDDFYWGEEPEDLQCSNVNYCPYCGYKIKKIIYIEESEGGEE